ncbi:unnamed protein product [Dibothriocephalus latus]|uniref:ATP-grasp domain-containing protein n=1 Tax=Dibothriocephalus latus TaxID=60516 RepID=A0A3P7NTH5_DIBLA|nr:unnamed protein product [Dibothriocephalus latus]
MQNIAQHCFLMVKDKLASRIGLFEIYGMDFMVDSHMNVFLIEINTNPAMSINCEVLKQVIPPVVSDFIDISVECFEKARRWKPLLPLQGISPLLCGYTESQTSQRSWTVSLNPLLDDEAVINYGLPPSFTVLYYETLDMARNRKATTNEVALRLWTSPHYPRLDNGENAKHKAETEKVNVVNLASALPTNPARLLPAKFPGQMASIRPVKTPSPSVHQSPKPKVLTHGPSKDYPGRVRLESKVPHGRPSPLGAARSPLPDILPKSTNVNCSLVSTLLDNLEAAYPPPGAFPARKGSGALERYQMCPNLTNNSAATEKGSNYHRKSSLSLRCRKLANRMLAPITKVEVISTEMPGKHLVYASPVHGSLAGSSPLFPRRCANRFSQVV